MLSVEDIRRGLVDRGIARSVDEIKTGHVRIETGLQYPDGSSIDVFVMKDMPLAPNQATRLSDLGQTTGWLLDLQVRPWLSKKRQRFIEDILTGLSVKQEGGALVVDLMANEPLVVGILRLGQACIRVADLMFTRRSSLQNPFTEDLEEVLADAEVPYQANAELRGRRGRLVRVDYLVESPSKRSAILALSATNAQSAHHLATEIFSRWYDLNYPDSAASGMQHVTVYDDRQQVYRDEDLVRLEDVSIVTPFSETDALLGLLRAA